MLDNGPQVAASGQVCSAADDQGANAEGSAMRSGLQRRCVDTVQVGRVPLGPPKEKDLLRLLSKKRTFPSSGSLAINVERGRGERCAKGNVRKCVHSNGRPWVGGGRSDLGVLPLISSGPWLFSAPANEWKRALHQRSISDTVYSLTSTAAVLVGENRQWPASDQHDSASADQNMDRLTGSGRRPHRQCIGQRGDSDVSSVFGRLSTFSAHLFTDHSGELLVTFAKG
ncbi:hypothetical protein TYRP_021326 [Tyrophagus putrescentiae]|nr:hypothetical protein TYRP_021326 [Tyrophagus putrescentiae]